MWLSLVADALGRRHVYPAGYLVGWHTSRALSGDWSCLIKLQSSLNPNGYPKWAYLVVFSEFDLVPSSSFLVLQSED